MKIPFGISTFQRLAAGVSLIALKNCMIEGNPILTDSQVSAVDRPAMRKFAEVGAGPIRSIYTAPSLFDDSLFVVSATYLHNVTTSGVVSTIGQLSGTPLGDVSWAATGQIGPTPPRLFLTEGGVLWLYTDDSESLGHLEASGAIANGDVVRIDSTYYQFTTGSVDTGTPAGTVGSPWLVFMDGTIGGSLTNLYNAINDTGEAGVDYSTLLEEHGTVRASAASAADLYVNAIVPGAGGDTIVTTETGANLSWGAGTLQNGGTSQLRQVQMPNDVGAISITFINGYVIVVPIQDLELETLGRFYWIEPGETYVDTLNFATAERTPDGVLQVGSFGNMFWLFGTISTEPWIATGNPDAPMERYQPIIFDRGSWQGTARQLKDCLLVIDEDGGVFRIRSGQERLSRPDIEERIRKAMHLQALSE